MSVNAESMAASFVVILERTRLRNPDLPAAIFRRSAWNFYGYLAKHMQSWGHHSQSSAT